MSDPRLTPIPFTDDDLTRLRDIYDEFETDGNGYIGNEDIKKCVQLFGLNPSDFEIDRALVRLEPATPGQLTFDELKSVVGALIKPKQLIEEDISDSLSTIIRSLKSSDGDIFNKEELKLFLQERGDEPLLQEEIDGLFNDIDPDNKTDTLTKTQLLELLNTQF